MPSIIDKKKKVFGNLAALRTSIEGLPQLSKSSSMPSINNNGDTIAFLCDLIKSLVGYESLVSSINKTLIHSLKEIESEIKSVIKSELKSIVNCGVNPSLPDFLKVGGKGINFTVNKIDFSNILQVNPLTVPGNLLYNDITTNLINSTDFNTFLYQTIQNDGTVESWGARTNGSNILDFKFESSDITHVKPNNTITVTANYAYSNKNLTDLNNDFVDSVSLFNTEDMVSNIVDNIFGSISSVLNKGAKQLENEAKINTVVNKILKSTNDTIDDSVFTFSNLEKQMHEQSAQLRKKGVSMLSLDNKIPSSISISTLATFKSVSSGLTSIEDKNNLMTSTIDSMATETASNSSNPIDTTTIKMNFIQQIIDNITRSIVNIILSPKVITIFIINFKIIYGQDAEFTDAVDFMKKNRVLLHNIMKRVSEIIIKQLLSIALKKITQLVSEGALKREIEKAKNTEAQILSLVGVQQSTLRELKGFL
jgi:hypothetical protein